MNLSKVGLFSAGPLGLYGGGEVISISIAKYLSGLDVNVRLYSDIADQVRGRVSEAIVERLAGLRVQRIPFEHSILEVLPFPLRQPLPPIREVESNDVSLLFTYRLPPREYLRRLARANVGVIFAFHGIGIQQLRHPDPRVVFYEAYLRAALSYSSGRYRADNIYVQVLTPQAKENIVRYGIPSRKVFVQPGGVPFTDYEVCDQHDVFRVIFAGRLEDTQKGIRRLLRTIDAVLAKNLPDIEFLIIGSGKDQYLIEQFADTHPALRYLGFVSDEEKRSCFGSANLAVVASNTEPFSLVTLEALASGLPVVTTPVPGPSSIVSTISQSGSVSSFSHLSLSSDIVRYYSLWKSSTVKYFEAKAARRERAKARYDIKNMLSGYLRMFVAVAKRLDAD